MFLADTGGEAGIQPCEQMETALCCETALRASQHLRLGLQPQPAGKGVGVALWTYLRLLGPVVVSHRLAVNCSSPFPTFVRESSSSAWSCEITSSLFRERLTCLPLKISISAMSWKSKAGDFCPLCILCSPPPQSWPASPSVIDSIVHMLAVVCIQERG